MQLAIAITMFFSYILITKTIYQVRDAPWVADGVHSHPGSPCDQVTHNVVTDNADNAFNAEVEQDVFREFGQTA